MLLYVADIVKQETTADGRANPRLWCIFENATECDLLSRSLAAELYKDGRRITEKLQTPVFTGAGWGTRTPDLLITNLIFSILLNFMNLYKSL